MAASLCQATVSTRTFMFMDFFNHFLLSQPHHWACALTWTREKGKKADTNFYEACKFLHVNLLQMMGSHWITQNIYFGNVPMSIKILRNNTYTTIKNWFDFILLPDHNIYICQKKLLCLHIDNIYCMDSCSL